MRHFIIGVVASLLVVPVTAQHSRPLESRIDRFNVPDAVASCGIDEPLMRLAQSAHILIGSRAKSDALAIRSVRRRFLVWRT